MGETKKQRSPLTTLCYIEKDDSYLMLHRIKKKQDVNEGKWIGVGGHFEENESPENCLLREVKEETGLTLTSWRFRGIVTFIAKGWPTEYMCLYTADGFEGTLRECDEGELAWVAKKDVSALRLWDGDRIFLKLLIERDTFFSLKLSYDGDELIEKFKQNGYAAMEAKIEKQNAVDKIKNEKYREENQNRYQYKEKTKMYHDLSDDYKSRDYVIAITLKEGDYYGNIFYEYSSGGYGLSVDIMEDILQFIENLDCEEINELNEEGLLNNNIALQADINGKDIHFELRNDAGEKLEKTIPEDELQKYIVGYEMIRCDGRGMKKERRKCGSCENFTPIEGCAKGNCSVRGDIIQRSRIICSHDYVLKADKVLC